MNKSESVAKKYRWLYLYAVLIMVLVVISGIVSAKAMPELRMLNTPFVTNRDIHLLTVSSAVFSIVANAALMAYIVLSKRVRRVLALLIVLDVLQLVGLVSLAFQPTVYAIVSASAQFLLTLGATLWLYRASQEERAVMPRWVRTSSIFAIIVRVIFRLFAISLGASLLVAAALVSIGAHSMWLRLGLPVGLLGILLATPYYMLRKLPLAAYSLALAAAGIWTLVSLHTHLWPGYPAPAQLPFPVKFDGIVSLNVWSILHAGGVMAMFGVLILIDTALAVLKRSDMVDEGKRQIKTIVLALTVLGVFVFTGAGFGSAGTQQIPQIKGCRLDVLRIGQASLGYCSQRTTLQ